MQFRPLSSSDSSPASWKFFPRVQKIFKTIANRSLLFAIVLNRKQDFLFEPMSISCPSLFPFPIYSHKRNAKTHVIKLISSISSLSKNLSQTNINPIRCGGGCSGKGGPRCTSLVLLLRPRPELSQNNNPKIVWNMLKQISWHIQFGRSSFQNCQPPAIVGIANVYFTLPYSQVRKVKGIRYFQFKKGQHFCPSSPLHPSSNRVK